MKEEFTRRHYRKCLDYLLDESSVRNMISRAMVSRYLFAETGIGISETVFQLYLDDFREEGYTVVEEFLYDENRDWVYYIKKK